MLGRKPLDERERGLERRTEDDRAIVAPARRGDFFARQRGELTHDFGSDRARKRRVVGDKDRLRRRIVFRLRQEVRGDKACDQRSNWRE